MLGVLRCAIMLPYAWQCRLGSGLGIALYHLHRKRRNIVATNIRLCFPDLSLSERTALAKENFRQTGISVFETALAWWGKTDRLRRLCQIEGLHHVHEALKLGKGVILLTGHSTSVEMGGRLFALYVPMQAIYRKVRNELVNAVTLHARRRGLVRVEPRTKLRSTIRGLKENVPTWYAPDQDFGTRGTVFADFMGVPAATLVASAKLAQLSGAKVVPFFPYRLPGYAGFKLVLDPPLEDFPSGDDHIDARRVNEVLEHQVARAPAQYLWAHRRFKTRPPGEPGIY